MALENVLLVEKIKGARVALVKNAAVAGIVGDGETEVLQVNANLMRSSGHRLALHNARVTIETDAIEYRLGVFPAVLGALQVLLLSVAALLLFLFYTLAVAVRGRVLVARACCCCSCLLVVGRVAPVPAEFGIEALDGSIDDQVLCLWELAQDASHIDFLKVSAHQLLSVHACSLRGACEHEQPRSESIEAVDGLHRQVVLVAQDGGDGVVLVGPAWVNGQRGRLVHHDDILVLVQDFDGICEARRLVPVRRVADPVSVLDQVVRADLAPIHGQPAGLERSDLRTPNVSRRREERSISGFGRSILWSRR